jgi:hypothetical protein
MTPKYGAGLLVAAYFMVGMAWTSMEAMPSFQNVTFKECRTTCGIDRQGRNVCTKTCSTTVGKREPTKATNAPPQGSTGPTVPPKPVGTHR